MNTKELLTKKSFTTLTGLNYHLPDVHLQKPAIFVEDALKIVGQMELPVMPKIAGIKEIILDKKNELTIEYNKLKAFDKSSNKRKMLMHSILVLKVILDKMESNFSA